MKNSTISIWEFFNELFKKEKQREDFLQKFSQYTCHWEHFSIEDAEVICQAIKQLDDFTAAKIVKMWQKKIYDKDFDENCSPENFKDKISEVVYKMSIEE